MCKGSFYFSLFSPGYFMLKVLLFILSHFFFLFANSQVNTKKIPIEFKSEFWMIGIAYPNNPSVNAPSYLNRYQNENFRFDRDTLKDSPLKHGAV